MDSAIMDSSAGVVKEVGIQEDNSCYPLQTQIQQMYQMSQSD